MRLQFWMQVEGLPALLVALCLCSMESCAACWGAAADAPRRPISP